MCGQVWERGGSHELRGAGLHSQCRLWAATTRLRRLSLEGEASVKAGADKSGWHSWPDSRGPGAAPLCRGGCKALGRAPARPPLTLLFMGSRVKTTQDYRR